ncbi:hypothetical protein [Herbaspirillum sp. RV1423]|uniref:hypothetical protein n=1 Tax=Herbaspirillum sp. RV1423 TaxID=1443993 RepID=UPI00055855DD|nr:hypothetical protein [Herbaspirillum sp. RV1423]
MSRYALFQMYGPFRQLLIERHEFYVRQARSRLLSQFGDIDGDAERAGKEWLERSGRHFDPDRDDEGAFYERAHDEAISFYTMLTEMHEQTRLSVVAGMYHEWDKQFRDWTVREIHHWHQGDKVAAKIWAQTNDNLADLFVGLRWDYRKEPYYEVIDTCRLVVNVYKHGKGNSLDELNQRHPGYFSSPFPNFHDLTRRHIDYQQLKVSDENITVFAEAITAFWKAVPENIMNDVVGDLPKWFGKAWLKDRESAD